LMVANISFEKEVKEDGRYILNGEKLVKVHPNKESIEYEHIQNNEETMSTS